MAENRKQQEENLPSVEEMNRISPGARDAIVLVAAAFRFGCNWGYIRSTDPNYKKLWDSLASEKKFIKPRRVSNGFVLLMNREYLLNNIMTVTGGVLPENFVEKSRQREKIELALYRKYLQELAAGGYRELPHKSGYYELQLGIFSVNQVNEIRLNGVNYPAYKLSLKHALSELAYLEKQGFRVLVRTVTEEGDQFVPVASVRNPSVFYTGLDISETGTGVFLTLRLIPQQRGNGRP